jgi:PAS domain S-box-containing protein
MYLNIYSIPVYLVAIMMAMLGLLTRSQKSTPGTGYFSLLMFSGAIYSIFYALEISSDSIQLVEIFYTLQYTGIPFIPAFFLLFTISYTKKTEVIRPAMLFLILFIPFLTFGFALSNSLHDLFISDGFLDPEGPFPVYAFNRGPLYWVHQVYSLIAILMAILMLFRMWNTSAPAFRSQVAVVLIGSSVPFVMYIFYILDMVPWGLDVNPFSFAVTGIFIFIGISKFKLFSLAPLARNMLFDSIPDGVVVIDRHFRLVDFNITASKILDINSRDIGKASGEVFGKWPEVLTFMTIRENRRDFEISRITESGSLFLKCYFTPLSDVRSIDRGQMLIIHDVTGQRKAELEKDESEEKFRLIFENAPLGLMYFDKDGIIELCNDDFIRILGTTEDKLIGLNLNKLSDKRIQDALITTFKGESAVFEGEYTSHTGTNKVFVRAISKPVFSKNNIVEGALCIMEDITMRMAVDENIRRTNAELKRLNAEKDKFFSILAHDLRSPFSAFLGFTDILVEGIDTLPAEMIKSIGVSMKESANNLYSLLENLLQWSRMQQASVTYNPESFILKNKILDTIEPLLINSNNKVIDVRYDIESDLTVFADMNMFETIIRNLFTNAVKFTPKEGSIIISATDTDSLYTELCFRDTGIGMNREMVDNLFRLDVKSSRPGTEGELSSGLGLILCKEYAEMNGGSIRVESEPGNGSSFYIRLKKTDH